MACSIRRSSAVTPRERASESPFLHIAPGRPNELEVEIPPLDERMEWERDRSVCADDAPGRAPTAMELYRLSHQGYQQKCVTGPKS
jgi:hypothetical protein